MSYAYLARLLDAASHSYEIRPLREAETALAATARTLLLRHDIDVDLRAAVQLAAIESERGITATYMVMTTSPLYRPESVENRGMLRTIAAAGHEIGLHFDFPDPAMRSSPPPLGSAVPLIQAAAARIEDLMGVGVRSVSFHRPLPGFLHGPLFVADRINAYAGELMAWYLSDSAGRWREGEPLPMIEQRRGRLLQLLIHPIWWGEQHRSAPERLQEFFERSTVGLTIEEAERSGRALADHIRVRRAGGAS